MTKINPVFILIFTSLIVAALASCKSKESSTPISFEAIRTKQERCVGQTTIY